MKQQISKWLTIGLIAVNAAVAGWVLLLGYIAMPVRTTVTYSIYYELETNGIVDVDALAEFRDGEYVGNLHLFTTEDLGRVTSQVIGTSNIVSAVLLTDCVAFVLLIRRRRDGSTTA